ncbi:MAG: VWA domain-containing protein [Planctomycetota bacterium]
MTWGNPNALIWLTLVPITAWLLYRAQRKRNAATRQFADPAMVARLMPATRAGRPLLKGSLLVVALASAIVAAARPQWGTYSEMVTQKGVDLFVLLDVSRSMLAKDVAPDRLQRAKSDIRDLLPKLAGDRVGLIAFAGQPVLMVPLTTDQEYFRSVLDTVDTSSAPVGGSLIGDAIRKAISSMEERRDRDQVLVLITDGEDHDSFPAEAAKSAAEQGIKIFTIGLGDPVEGARVPAGKSGYVTHDGQEV